MHGKEVYNNMSDRMSCTNDRLGSTSPELNMRKTCKSIQIRDGRRYLPER